MQKTREGILELPIDGCARTPFKQKYFKSPMNALAVSLNAREKPQKNHWKETIAADSILMNIIDRAFFLRSKPE